MAVYCGAAILLVALLALTGQHWETSACSCMPMHPQRHYCDSDMVIRGKIMRKEMMYQNGTAQEMTEDSEVLWLPDNPPEHLRYTVKIKKMYKMPASMNETLQMDVITKPMSASCGVMGMKKSGVYAIAGNIEDSNKLRINSCGLVTEYSSLTKQQRQGLKSTYGRDNCSCEVKMVKPGGVQSSDDDSIDWCPYWPYTADYKSPCEEMYSSCLRNDAGKCKWKMNKTMKTCVQNLEEKSS